MRVRAGDKKTKKTMNNKKIYQKKINLS